MSKICRTCGIDQKPSDYQRDGRGGRRHDCKWCMSKARNKKKKSLTWEKAVSTIHPIENAVEDLEDLLEKNEKNTTKISIIPEEESILDTIRKKHDCHFVLSVNGNGKTILQIHANPNLIYKGSTPTEALEAALR